MTVRTTMTVVVMVVASVLCLGLGGCGGAVRYDVCVTRDAAIQGMSVQVDIIGVNNEITKGSISTCDVNKYWAADGTLRSTFEHHAMQFAAGDSSTKCLPKTDDIWEKWNQPTSLVVIALIPGVGADKGADPRRQVLSLDSKEWKDRKLDIRVGATGVMVMAPGKAGY